MGELPIVSRLRRELETLRAELRRDLPRQLEAARAHGDIRENAEYDAAKQRQGVLAARVAQLEHRIAELSRFSLDAVPRDRAAYGSRVTLVELETGDEVTFELVFPEELGNGEEGGRVSIGSPIGRALVGRREGDEVTIHTPSGRRVYEIVGLETLHERSRDAAE